MDRALAHRRHLANQLRIALSVSSFIYSWGHGTKEDHCSMELLKAKPSLKSLLGMFLGRYGGWGRPLSTSWSDPLSQSLPQSPPPADNCSEDSGEDHRQGATYPSAPQTSGEGVATADHAGCGWTTRSASFLRNLGWATSGRSCLVFS